MARIVALIYNGWNLYTRLAVPDKHSEAITSRPLLLSGIGRLVKSGHQKKLKLTSMHGEADKLKPVYSTLSRFFEGIRSTAA